MAVPTHLLGATFLLAGVAGLNSGPGLLLGLFTADLGNTWLHLVLGAVLLVGGTAGGRCGTGAQLLAGSLAGTAGTLGLALTGAGPYLATTADNVLHLGTALVLLVLGLARTAEARPEPEPQPEAPVLPRLRVATYCGR
ncbi:hypothetical protein JOF53_002743 [Crossiella equi]|uniref:DUF4383 domain-containing protein n=1 Tax=Crossiella equi TaxID=130796 RepID=A0ABS5AC06_9PSEU|nr:hypothetical protein [Crossiella equi]MBP2473871.1 hypothetical protein [Crossiella equi]